MRNELREQWRAICNGWGRSRKGGREMSPHFGQGPSASRTVCEMPTMDGIYFGVKRQTGKYENLKATHGLMNSFSLLLSAFKIIIAFKTEI